MEEKIMTINPQVDRVSEATLNMFATYMHRKGTAPPFIVRVTAQQASFLTDKAVDPDIELEIVDEA